MSALTEFLQMLSGSAPAYALEKPIHREEPTDVSASPLTNAIIFDSGEKIKSPAAKFGKENIDAAIQDRAIDFEQNLADKQSAMTNFNESRGNLLKAYNDMSVSGPSRVSPYIDRIKTVTDEYELSKDEAPKPDYMTSAILALGPALLGSGLGFGGSAGRLASKETADYTVPMIAKNIEAQKLHLLKKREQQLKAMNYLIQAEKADADNFSSESKAALDRAKAVIDLTKDIKDMDEKQLQQAEKYLAQSQEDILKYRSDGTKSIMNTELESKRIEQSGKNAEITAGINQQKLEEQKRANDRKFELQKQKNNQKKTGGARSEAQKKVDQDYAKHYNEFSGRGAANARITIEQLKAFKRQLEKEDGMFQAGGGRIGSMLPDAMRTDQSLIWKKDIPAKANLVLKDLFGGQLSNDERKSESSTYYDDALGPQQNAKKLAEKIKQLEAGYANESRKAKYYEERGTLEGFQAELPTSNPQMTREQKIELLKKKGFK